MAFRSLKSKIVWLVLSCILFISFSSVTIAYASLTRILNESVISKMNLFCEREGLEVDQLFITIEDAVDTIALFLQNRVEDAESLADPKYRQELLKETDDLFSLIARSTNGIVANYVSFNPELIDGIDGFLYRLNKKGNLEPVELTDIRKYDPSDVEHVGWFYIPVNNKKGTWMEPYQNKNLDCYMISYVVPVFKKGTLLCIVGMDVDFKIMVDSVARIQFNKSGSAYLKNTDGSIHYHEETINGDDIHGDKILEVTENAALLGKRNTENSIIRYKLDGVDNVMTFVTLRNGMKIVLCDNYKEVYANRIDAVILIIALTALLGAVFMIIAINVASHMIEPLENLSKAANMISEGNFDVILPMETNDEIGIMIRGLRTAIENLKKYTSNMEALAYQDPLTKVKNFTSYKLTVKNIEKQIHAGTAEFAVVMCDLNYLKKINDTFGHKAGDEAIKKASKLICRAFPYSTVFRIGGDEFVVILQGVEYENRSNVLESFDNAIKANEEALRKGEPCVTLAYGMAVYIASEDQSYQSVFERADSEMYCCKERMHAARGNLTDKSIEK